MSERNGGEEVPGPAPAGVCGESGGGLGAAGGSHRPVQRALHHKS